MTLDSPDCGDSLPRIPRAKSGLSFAFHTLVNAQAALGVRIGTVLIAALGTAQKSDFDQVPETEERDEADQKERSGTIAVVTTFRLNRKVRDQGEENEQQGDQAFLAYRGDVDGKAEYLGR